MHDPLVVAFEIRRPWPRRVNWTGRRWYWPSMITIWHREPGGHDSGDVCKHYTRTRAADGTWQTKVLRGWRWHVHHWRIQVGPLQNARRWLLTRCAWCGGRKKAPWWRGEQGLYHLDCSGIEGAHRTCVCEHPLLEPGAAGGSCLGCGKARPYGRTAEQMAVVRQYAAIPAGERVGRGGS